ncbi:MAG: transcriptional regulator [Lachnospiraceae bacterium]|nr:transcriptional regulator [Lachnospiraceae bacterium]
MITEVSLVRKQERKFTTPDSVTGEDVKLLRRQLQMTQREFAAFVGTSLPTVERWEQSKQEIRGPLTLLYEILFRFPEYAERLMIPEKIFPLRLWYMHKKMVCTIIDVDLLSRRVQIKNFHPNVLYCAFGNETQPSFEDYEEFLESRCFPRERDKMKLMLKEMDIPFYDPLMIIEKTEGRMEEDDFWIRLER